MPLDEAGWNWLVRRAAGVPDLIGDEVAMEIIGEVVFSHRSVKGERPTNPHDEIAERITQEILDTFCRMGREGELDSYLMDRPVDSLQRLAERVVHEVRVATRIKGLPKELAIPLLEKVKVHVLAHPFEDPAPSRRSLAFRPRYDA